MELETLQELIGTPEQLISVIVSEKASCAFHDGVKTYGYADGIKQYDPQQHKIKDKYKRPDKKVLVPTEQKDALGETVMQSVLVETTRMALPIQKYIIDQRASFAVGNKVTLKPSVQGSTVYDAVDTQWKKNKVHFLLKDVARRMMSETEVAVIFYSEPAEKAQELRMRVKVVSPSTGSELFPVFNAMDDLIAFGRRYKIGTIECFDLYTDKLIYRYQNRQPAGEPTKIPYGKIPVVYWHQDKPECQDVQDIIEARERIQSDFFDTNLRMADPILFLKGKTMNMPQAGEPGKVLEGDETSDGKYLTPANPTEARKLEFEMLDDLIYSLTRTVKLSPENLKGLGIESGAAMDRILIASHMAAKDMQDGEFGMGVQRMLNFLVHVYSDVLSAKGDLEIEPVFTLFRIDDATERVDLAMKANGGKPIVSQKTSIQQAGFTDDPDAEYQAILDQAGEETETSTNPIIPVTSGAVE